MPSRLLINANRLWPRALAQEAGGVNKQMIMDGLRRGEDLVPSSDGGLNLSLPRNPQNISDQDLCMYSAAAYAPSPLPLALEG